MFFPSPDGCILGKMAHSDRISDHVLQNIPGAKDQKIFALGVQYFQRVVYLDLLILLVRLINYAMDV